MGYVKEPEGVDFVVDSSPVTEYDKLKISEAIAYYKKTGRKMPVRKKTAKSANKPARQIVA